MSKQLKSFASECQMEADNMAYRLVTIHDAIDEAKEIFKFQSFCDFNLFWLYSIAPNVILHLKTIQFLNTNSDKIKRKLKIKELLKYDAIINFYKPQNFDQFKILINSFGKTN